MTPPTALRPEDVGTRELLGDYEALRTWEVLRSSRLPVTVADLAGATGLAPRTLQRHLDLLARHGLVDAVRARKPRRSIGYRVSTDRIVVTFDDGDPESVTLALASSDAVRREFERCLERHADPEFHPKAGFRFRQHTMQHFTPEDLAELRRRMLAVIEFLATPRPRPPQPKQASGGRIPPPFRCNQAISIRIDPLVGDLLPLPAVWMTPRSKAGRAEPVAGDRTGLPALSPREREVATLARRVYRKLGVSSQAALAARLAGHARRRLGER